MIDYIFILGITALCAIVTVYMFFHTGIHIFI